MDYFIIWSLYPKERGCMSPNASLSTVMMKEETLLFPGIEPWTFT
jgi:hypothetical protein